MDCNYVGIDVAFHAEVAYYITVVIEYGGNGDLSACVGHQGRVVDAQLFIEGGSRILISSSKFCTNILVHEIIILSPASAQRMM